MARETGAAITFYDAINMVNQEGYMAYETIPSSNQCMNRSAIEYYLNVDNSLFTNYSSNQLVPYNLIQRGATDLIIHLDAANSESYPGSGTTWYDLSGHNNHGTFPNVTYSTDMGGSMYFNGSGHVVIPFDANSMTFNDEQTVIICMKSTDNDSKRRNPYNQAYGGGGTMTHEPDGDINYYSGTSGTDGGTYQSVNSPEVALPLEPLIFAATRSSTNMITYKNGSQFRSGPGLTAVTGTNDIKIGGGYVENFIGNIAYVKVYNRALTSQEILDDYNEMQSRIATATSTLTITPTSRSVSEAAGSFSITATSNTSWTVSDNASWVTISGATGLNNDTFTVNYTNNASTTNSRSATITVTTYDGTVSRTCTLTQAAAPVVIKPVLKTPVDGYVHVAGTSFTYRIESLPEATSVMYNINGVDQIGSTTAPEFPATIPGSYVLPGNYVTIAKATVNGVVYSSDPVSSTVVANTADTQAPTFSTGLTYTNLGYNSVTLNWGSQSDNVGVTSLRRYIRTNGGSWSNTSISVGTTSTNLSGLSPNHSYEIYMNACDAAGNCTNTNTISFTTTNAPDTESPIFASALTYNNTSPTNVNLSWGAVSDNVGVTTLRIYMRVNSGSWNYTNLSTSTTSTSVTLSPGTSYEFYIRAYDAAGNYTSTNTIGFTTQSIPKLATPYLYITDNQLDSLTVEYNAVSGANRYLIQISTNESFSSVTTHYTTATSFLIPNLSEDVNYFIRVQAQDTTNYAPNSNYGYISGGTGAFPTPPYNIVAYMTGSTLNVSWSPGQNATSYTARYYFEPFVEWITYSGIPPTENTGTVEQVTLNRTLVFQMGLYNQYGTAWSETVVVQT